jgi:hypothetical protein
MKNAQLLLLLAPALCAGCLEPFEVSQPELRGSLGDVREFDRAPDSTTAFHDLDRSVVELESHGDTGWIVMTRLTVMGHLDRLEPGTEVSYEPTDGVKLLGCSGPDGSFLFDRHAQRVRVRVETTDDPATRRVLYVGEWDLDADGRTHSVEGSFDYTFSSE